MIKYDNFICLAASRTGHNFIRANIFSWLTPNWKRGDGVIIKYHNAENIPPNQMDNYIQKRNMTGSSLIVIVTRDYLNWLASL